MSIQEHKDEARKIASLLARSDDEGLSKSEKGILVSYLAYHIKAMLSGGK